MALCVVAPVCVGCGEVISGIDTNKTQIYAYVPDVGFGTQWLEDAAADFNAEAENSEYEVVVVPFTGGLKTIETNLMAKTEEAHVIFSTTMDVKSMITNNLLLDISDVWSAVPTGEDESVREKMTDSENFEKAFCSVEGTGVYGIPYGNAFNGLIFDFDMFLERGWLILNNDNSGLSVGPDGLPGTYDDGQPRNMQEFDSMIRKISSDGAYPFVYTAKYPGYLTPIADALFAQYEGLENYRTFHNYSGEYLKADSTVLNITPATGYLAYEMDGITYSIEFMKKYLANQEYVHPATHKMTSLTHKEAQSKFILGYKNASDNPLSAFLIDGTYWENEARPIFETLSKGGEADHGYGVRDYRYLMLPRFDGQKGTTSVFASMDAGAAVVVDNNDKAVNDMAKKFLIYTCMDKYLKKFTLYCGAVRPFSYELTESELNQLTVFQRNVWKLYQDSENVTILCPAADKLLSPLQYASGKPANVWQTNIAGKNYTNIIPALEVNSAEAYLTGMREFYKNNWNNYYKSAEKYL